MSRNLSFGVEVDQDFNEHVEIRVSRNEAKRAGDFRDDAESGIDVEYRKTRLEQVILVSIWSSAVISEREAIYSMDELERLAITAGANVLDRIMQQRSLPDRSTYVGKGKAQELARLVEELEADTVIVNETLAPSTRRALEDLVNAKVLDRTALILDIFAQHAKSKAGRAQVELAQLEYLLPRLRGWGAMMSRQGGGQVSGGAGMGSRGPGETQLEIDRRRITGKIALLKKRISKIKKERLQSRQRRLNGTTPSVAIVGYTNTGKSSLLNLLTNADIIIQDALFATLDTTTRSVEHPKYTLTDTVGFIQDLPTTLVEAFRSTLEEAADSDLILHLADASAPKVEHQISTVNEILSDIRSIDDSGKVVLKDPENELLVFNKIDLISQDELDRLERLFPHALFISAVLSDGHSHGIDTLLEAIEKKVLGLQRFKDFDQVIPYSAYERVNEIYERGEVVKREDLDEGVRIVARVPLSFNLESPLIVPE